MTPEAQLLDAEVRTRHWSLGGNIEWNDDGLWKLKSRKFVSAVVPTGIVANNRKEYFRKYRKLRREIINERNKEWMREYRKRI